jgi:hypothetical protein
MRKLSYPSAPRSEESNSVLSEEFFRKSIYTRGVFFGTRTFFSIFT